MAYPKESEASTPPDTGDSEPRSVGTDSWKQSGINQIHNQLGDMDKRLRRVEIVVYAASLFIVIALALIAYLASLAQEVLLLWMQQG